MPYLAVLASVAFLFWFLLDRCSWSISLLISVLLFWLTISATNFTFPFWKIYLPQTRLSLAFTLIFICLPLALLNGLALSKIFGIVKQTNKRRKEFIVALIFLVLGLLFFVVGFVHNAYQSIPVNNLNLYLKHREYIVSLIKSGTLHGERSCIQNFQLYESEFQEDQCSEVIKLPNKYKGLSRNGKIYLTKTQKQLSIRFTHSTYRFGDGSIDIVYSSFDNSLSKPKWEINPPPLSNNQAKIGAICPSSKKNNKNSNKTFLKQSDQPPTVNISIRPSAVKRGKNFTVTVHSRDDQGLESIWWFGEQTGDNNIDKAHRFDCNGKQSCAFNEIVSTQVIGNLMLLANARDLAYPTISEAHQASEGEGIACATVTVTK